MKKSLKICIAMTISVMLFPLQGYALRQDVGVKVKGDTSISAITTISSDITIDVENKTTNQSYIELQNKTSVPLDVKITNIEALTADAPSNFVGVDEILRDAGVDDTKSKIGFRISKDGQAPYTAILPNTEIDLGVVSATKLYSGEMGVNDKVLDTGKTISYSPYELYMNNYEYENETFTNGSEIYKLEIENGYAWTETDLNFYYGITMVVGFSEQNYDRNAIPELGIDGINVALLKNASNRETYVELYLDGLTEPLTSTPSYGNVVYTDENGNSHPSSVEYLGLKVNKKMVFNQTTSEFEEVEGVDPLGVSYFFKIDLDSAEDNRKLFELSKPIYINFSTNISKADGSNIKFSDILTNKSIN